MPYWCEIILKVANFDLEFPKCSYLIACFSMFLCNKINAVLFYKLKADNLSYN